MKKWVFQLYQINENKVLARIWRKGTFMYCWYGLTVSPVLENNLARHFELEIESLTSDSITPFVEYLHRGRRRYM